MSTDPKSARSHPFSRPGVLESFVDRQIREAVERGEFDDLPGAGRPLDSLEPVYDPEWWAKGFMKREKARDVADRLRRTIRDELPRLRVAVDAAGAAKRVAELNAAIAEVNRELPSEHAISPIRL